MAFTTKKYTRPTLRKELQKLPARAFSGYNTFVQTLSPRAGADSAKVTALADLLGGRTNLRRYFLGGPTPAARKTGMLFVLKTMSRRGYLR